MTNEIRECEACANVEILKEINNLQLCSECYAKELLIKEQKSSQVKSSVEIEKSETPINERLRRAYIDKTNEVLVSGMSHSQLMEHLADLEDHIKVFQTQVQALYAINDEWSKDKTETERAALREQDRKYRLKARPNVKSDGTLKTGKPKTAQPQILGDSGTKAFDSLVEKLTRTGMSKENAEKMIRGMKG